MVYTTIPLCLSNFNTLPRIFSIIKFHLLASDIFCFFITPGTDSIIVSAGKSLYINMLCHLIFVIHINKQHDANSESADSTDR